MSGGRIVELVADVLAGNGRERHRMRAKSLDPGHAVVPTPLAAARGPRMVDARINSDVISPDPLEIAAAMRGDG